jgi:hypothetical protein
LEVTLGDGSSKVWDTAVGHQLISSWAPADYFAPYTVSCILLVTSVDTSPFYLKATTST